MIIEVKVPSPGESISEVEVANWFVASGDYVEKDQEIGEIESEKATLPLIAGESGAVEILVEVGETVPIGKLVCKIDTSAKGNKPAEKALDEMPVAEKSPEVSPATKTERKDDVKDEISKIKSTPLAKKIMDDSGLNINDIINGLRKLSSKDVNAVIQRGNLGKTTPALNTEVGSREEERTKITNLRKKLSQRLVAVKNETAMLTTFNEADMSKIIALRKKHQASFLDKHGVKLGFMSFFTKAVAKALQEFPNVNSRIEGEEIVKPSYYDIGIAVQTEKGLMVPVLRNVESMGLANIEKQIIELAAKARINRLSIEDMSGGSFTITNGGIFGSMLSTPIINPPQSAILGMHNIIERPVAIDGQVVIRPMMYLALSYDHRIIDGRDSVGFLVKIKEYIEDPEKMLFDGMDPEKLLLQL